MADALDILRKDAFRKRVHGVAGGNRVLWGEKDLIDIHNHTWSVKMEQVIQRPPETKLFGEPANVDKASLAKIGIELRDFSPDDSAIVSLITNETTDHMNDRVKPFARDLLIAAQTTRPDGVAGIRPRDPLRMFDSRTPDQSGSFLGESFAATLESHPRYPSLRKHRHANLFETLDLLVECRIGCIADLLPGFGFDVAGIALYRAAALSAFRAAIPVY